MANVDLFKVSKSYAKNAIRMVNYACTDIVYVFGLMGVAYTHCTRKQYTGEISKVYIEARGRIAQKEN